MIHDITVDPVTLMYMSDGILTFHQMDNLYFCLQKGDLVHFKSDGKHPRYPEPQTVTGGVLIVKNQFMPANFITFGFVHLKTEEEIMSWGMSNQNFRGANGLSEWQLKGYASQDDYERLNEIDQMVDRIQRENKRKYSKKASDRLTELFNEKMLIEARKTPPQEIN